MYGNVLSTESDANIEVLNSKGIKINSHPADWFNIVLSIKSKRKAHPEYVKVSQFTS